jgi:hypothetical protein
MRCSQHHKLIDWISRGEALPEYGLHDRYQIGANFE